MNFDTIVVKRHSALAVVLGGLTLLLMLLGRTHVSALDPSQIGITIDSMETVGDWYVMMGNGAISATLSAVPGCTGQALQLDYNLGTSTGAWVQLCRDFDPPLDLSSGDHLRFSHRGTTVNTLEVGLVSSAGENYFGVSWNEATHVPWCTRATWDLLDFRQDGQPFPDLGQVGAVFISVVKTDNSAGGAGSFVVDELGYLDVASRTVSADFTVVTAALTVTQQAATWIGDRQQPGGLLKSWQEEPSDYAWLYDQALALIVLSETDMSRANQLAAKLHDLQNGDGSWYVGYHYVNDDPIETKKDVGPIAWLVYALTRYHLLNGDSAAYEDAREGAAWLATQQTPEGSLGYIMEWNLDAWWAFQATGYQAQADLLRDFMLSQVWDDVMGRFKSSPTARHILLDNQTWGAAFLRAVGRDDDARRALSYAQATLATASSDGSVRGFDGAGPFSVWNEGTLQYIVAGGADSQDYWEQMVNQQAPDGGLPNSPDEFLGYIVWLSPWHGVAPTSWLYFAGTGGPFHVTRRVFLPLVFKN